MMVILDLRSCRPSREILTLSTRMIPPAGSIIRNIAKARDDLPAPVRPTMPTYIVEKSNGLYSLFLL